MGISLNEVEPVFGLDKWQTRELALCLASRREPHEKIPFDALKAACKEFNKQRKKDGLHLPDLKPEETAAGLAALGWMKAAGQQGGKPVYELSLPALNAAFSVNAARMSFKEALEAINGVRERLDAAPEEIKGITPNRAYLYGSSLRDRNERETIGDLDLLVDMSFDGRYEGAGTDIKENTARKIWRPIIGERSGRISFAPGVPGNLLDVFTSAAQHPSWTDYFGHAHVVLQIWSSKHPGPSIISDEQLRAIAKVEENTLLRHERARAIHAMVHGPQQGKQC